MIRKNYSKKGKSCRVTFELPPEVNAQTACVCGEFNAWDVTTHPMKHRQDGSFTLTVSLKPGQPYRFRYLLDGKRWENDWAADAYVPNTFGSDDSVMQL
jgi:1,4-alpha-glucan branching enzyme